MFYKHLPHHIPRPLTEEGMSALVHSTPDDVPGKYMVDHEDLKRLINPVFMNWIENEIGLLIADVEIFYSPPNYFMPIHTDGENIHSEAKLNFMYGAPKSQMKWWMPKEGAEARRSKMDHDNAKAQVSELVWDVEDCMELDSTEVFCTLVQVGIPHNVVNLTLPRKCVSVIFDKPRSDGGRDELVTFEEAVEKFSNEDAYYF